MTNTTSLTTFLRLLAADDKSEALSSAVATVRRGEQASEVYVVNPASFRLVPGAPFAYWLSESLRHKFEDLPAFEVNAGEGRVGLATGDDFRFVRLFWEVRPEVDHGTVGQGIGRNWIPFAKGGEYSPFYSDLHLVVDWHDNGKTIEENFVGARVRKPYFFKPGLSWSARPHRRGSFSYVPSGALFSHNGMMVFPPLDRCPLTAAILNSDVFIGLLHTLMPRGVEGGQTLKYEVGYVSAVPVPDVAEMHIKMLTALSARCYQRLVRARTLDERTHVFVAPALVDTAHGSLSGGIKAWADDMLEAARDVSEAKSEIDDIAFELYGVAGSDREIIDDSLSNSQIDWYAVLGSDRADDDAPSVSRSTTSDWQLLVSSLMSYLVGCAFGRWDVRIGHDPSLAPALADPFAPLPVCAPGALVGTDGLPASRERIASEEWMRARPDAITLPPEGAVAIPAITADDFPLPVAWEGLLADDPDAPNDIVRRVRAVFDALFGDRADAIEAEAVSILGVRDLREYFRNPRLFFDFHIGRYSKSRRKAPIYWLLQSPRRNYAIWLYYHRLDADLIFKALTLHLLPKIAREEQRLAELAARKSQAEGTEARRLGKEIERQEALLADLREFHAALDRAAKHYLVPDLNDGVLLTIAPLWEVVPWKEAKTAWQQLLAGKYAWSSIAQQLREKSYVKCTTRLPA